MATHKGVRTVDRRAFLRVAGATTGAALTGGIPAIVAAQKAPSFPKGTKLNILEWVSFVPASDVEFKRLAGEFGKLAGVDVTVDLINMNDLNPRIASAIETKSGPDIIMMIGNWPHLYAGGLADVDDVAEEIGKRDGGYYELNRRASVVDNRWKAVPLCTVTPTWNYREDWFKEAGATKFPDTWDELRKVGTELKKKGRPIGQAFGHSLGDPNGWAYGVTWCFGGAEIDDKGKVAINRRETIDALKFIGMLAALLLNHHFRFKRIVRASMLLPWIVPTVLSTLAWQWMFDATFSVFNWTLMNAGLISKRILWLGDGTLAMGCLIAVNVWRGMPFFAITLLAGLQTVNPDLHEAAEIDGANAWQRFWRVTLPLIKPIMLVVVLFSMIATFADFQLIYVLTRGGPYSSTHVFGTYAYEIAMRAAKLGQGASISLSLFPFLLVVIVFQLWYIRRSD